MLDDPFRFLGAALAGVGATLIMDLWNLFLKSGFGIPSLDYCLLGRWLAHVPTGTFSHTNIATARPMPFECALGRAAHYSIGIVFGVVFIRLAPGDWLAKPTLIPALAFGIGTIIFPLFVMQPAFGLGIAASKTPAPTKARLKSLATHTVFGVGLYLSALVGAKAFPTLFSIP